MRTKHILLGALLCAGSFAACKKDKNDPAPPPAVNCDILTEMRLDTTVHTYEYDADDRLIKHRMSGADRSTLVYENGGSKVIETESGGIITYIVGSNGRASSKEISYSSGYVEKSFYTYDANKFITQVIQHSFDIGSDVPEKDTVYRANTVANGNLVKLVTGGTNNEGDIEATLSYDLTRPNTVVDPRPFNPDDLLAYNKNLVKTMQLTIDGEVTNGTFAYEYDSKGRVTKRTTTSTLQGNPPYTSVTTYKYRCE